MIIRQTLPPDPESVGEARQLIAAALVDLSTELVGDIKLMASELATNSVLHARSPFELTVFRTKGQIRVEVADSDPLVPQVQEASPLALRGRGLQIVATLSTAWGVEPLPDGGKVTWFTIDEKAPF